MRRVHITGIGVICSLGNTAAEVTSSLREMRHGIELYPPFAGPESPVKVVGTLKGFDVRSWDPEDWTHPSGYRFRRDVLRGLSPHGLFALCAVQQALADAKLGPAEVSHPGTGLYTASAGSVRMLHHNLTVLKEQGVGRAPPLGIVASAVGTLNFNLVAHHRILGVSCGFASACASSAHALGFAFEEVASGRQDRMLVVGAEDGDADSILPFAGMRTLSLQRDPGRASRPFDRDRDGFVGTGGAAVLVLESDAEVARRGVEPYAEILGWGQASDGYNVAISHPDGDGLARAMEVALARAGVTPAGVSYVNAHATSTTIGDVSEARALRRVLGEEAGRVGVSSTKGLSGHGISLAGALETVFVLLAMRAGFTPGGAGLENPDPECGGLNLLRENLPTAPDVALNNNSGFGGANVCVVLKRAGA